MLFLNDESFDHAVSACVLAAWIPAYAGMTVRDARVMTGPAQPCPSGLRIKSAMTWHRARTVGFSCRLKSLRPRCASVCACNADSGLGRNDSRRLHCSCPDERPAYAGNDRDGTTLPLWIADQVRNDCLSRHSCSSHGVDYSCGPGWDCSVC